MAQARKTSTSPSRTPALAGVVNPSLSRTLSLAGVVNSRGLLRQGGRAAAPAIVAPADRSLFRGYRFPPELLVHAIGLDFRFHLSLRDVQDRLAERGLIVSRESIRYWCDTSGPTFAAGLRQRQTWSGGKWHPASSPHRLEHPGRELAPAGSQTPAGP